jgi:hypothetical protein
MCRSYEPVRRFIGLLGEKAMPLYKLLKKSNEFF